MACFSIAIFSFAAIASAIAFEAQAAVDPAPPGAGWGLSVGLGVAGLLFGSLLGAWLCIFWQKRQTVLGRALLAAVPNPRQAVDADGKVVYANPAFREVYGETSRPTAALLLEEVGQDEEARDLIQRLDANARKGVPGQGEVRISTPDAPDAPGRAAIEWRLVTAYPVSRLPGAVYWGIDDITTQRQVEEVIHEEQERFVDLLEHAPIGFYSVDGEGRFLFVNRTLMEWLHLSNEDLESGRLRLHDVIAGELPEGCAAHDPFGDPAATYGEVSLKTTAGIGFNASINQDVVANDEGGRLRTRSVVRDLSRERAMAEALERSEERFGRFFQEAPVGIVLLNAAGEITECNPAFCQLVGRQESEVRRERLIDLLHADDRDNLERAFALDDEASLPAKTQRLPTVHFGKEKEIICTLYLSRMGGEEGAPLGYIGHFINTTEQHRLELQFTQAQKMQAVGQLAGGIAHDFNNLLTAMIGFSDLLLLRHRPGDQSFADIMQIKQNANRAANLVRQLLAFSRQQTLQPRRLNVTDILAELAHLLRRLIGENIELKISHHRDLGLVKADEGQLEQVIINLAVNARDAMTGGGVLSIRTANDTYREAKTVNAETMPAGDYVLIEVSDTGCGIPPEIIDRIFEPFFSTKEVGQGTGLGLSTVYGIIKQSGGFVFVKSRPDKGTTFSIYLPSLRDSEDDVVEPVADEEETRDLTGKGTLLLVEDEDAVRAFGARALRNKGYDVLEADCGETAIELMREETNSVDLLITDVVMPRLDGPGLVRQIKETLPEIKVIFISGYAEDAFRKSLDEDVGIHFLAKPFTLKQLAAKVKEVLDA